MPFTKYSFSGSSLSFQKGLTAIDFSKTIFSLNGIIFQIRSMIIIAIPDP
jgi:hypothetical protein